MRNLPDAAALDLAQTLGITHLVIHFHKLPPRLTTAQIRQWEAVLVGRRLIETHRSGHSRVYRLRGP